MTIRKRLQISYTLLVIIPFILFLSASFFISDYYKEKLHTFKLAVQTNKFNKVLYQNLANNPDSLLTIEMLKKLINLTESPETISAFTTIDGKQNLSIGEKTQNRSNDFYEQKYINYWLFNISDGRTAEIFFINSNFGSHGKSLTILFPISFYIILITILSIITSRKITKPLKMLKEAAINIKNEEFDIELNYNANDEINDVFTAFDDMRVRLKHIMEKQLKYEQNRTELISNISHDLKTPITGIKGYIEGLVDGVANTPEKIAKYHETIYKKITLLDKLIENLFLYSKLDLKTIPFNFQKLNINLFISDLLEEVRFDEPNMDIKYLKSDKILSVSADPIQLQRVIHNLVGNSKKYCNKDRCLIEINVSTDEKMAIISLKDNGIGISESDIKEMFKRFYRSDPARSSSTEGSGLGLAISKQIIHEHNGKIFATNNKNEGLTVTFKLPLLGANR